MKKRGKGLTKEYVRRSDVETAEPVSGLDGSWNV
jgi:hypothetical protein